MTTSHGTATKINMYKFSIGVGTESTYKYDKTGNVTEYTSPDAGKVTMTYTPQGQIKSRTTATGDITEYGYSGNRLVSIKYPSTPNDSVMYTYADSTAAEPNSKGRLTEVKDPSGTERYTYGSMGEVIKTERTLNIDPQTGTVHSYTYGAAYDSWGRVREMTYPDGETVTYQYYPTGELRSITGESGNGGETYLDRAGYDPYGRTIYRKMGNGTEHTYTYDINERLKNSLLSLDGETVSSSTYTYDKTDNITGIRGVSESLYNQKYTYDDMNRLTGASGMDTGGKSDDGSAFSSYVMSMSYNQMSSPQRYELTKMSQSDTKVTENEYLYSTESRNPHAPMQIGDTRYTYSASGNPLTIEGSKISRTLTWDAENRLRELTDQSRGIQSRYTYNHTGERSLKRYGAYESMAVNGAAAGSLLDPKSAYSAYVSPYYVEHGRGTESGAVTKHYYAGAERLISKVVTSATGTKGESQNGSQSSVQTEESTYYYFTDHLGSTTHITDRSGRTSQYAAYTPYGELFREYKKVLPYKFNGKELDQETGYYYYGARYYDPGTALWFGTDPLASKYPMNSPYVYCNGNPVRYVDPDGNIVLVAKLSASAGAGAGYGLSIRGEVGVACDKYGATMFSTATGNYFVNQNLQERSRNPRVFAGVYAGVNAGFDISWGCDSYADYASSFLMSIPVGPASVSVGNEGAEISIGIGAGIAFESSPSSVAMSLSMSYEEFGTAVRIFTQDTGSLNIQSGEFDEISGVYKGVATISKGSDIVKYDVTCKAVNGQPSNQWETKAYSANKQTE